MTGPASPLGAVEAWINGHAGLRGSRGAPGPLAVGATCNDQEPPKSPATGAFCLLQAGAAAGRSPVAEDDAPRWVRVSHLVFGQTAVLANVAAEALADAIRVAAPPPAPMGSMLCLGTANVTAPATQPAGVDQWDYCQQVSGDYLLIINGGGG